MKTKLQFCMSLILVFSCLVGFAQKEITVKIANKTMSRGEQPGFQVNIPEAKVKDMMDAYEKQLEANTKSNAKEINGELINYGAVNKTLSPNPFIVYAKFLETVEGVELTIFVTEDSVAFIGENSDPDKAAAVTKSLRDFAVNEYKKIKSKKLDAEKDKLEELKKELDRKIKNESDNISSISKKNREIESYKSKIEDNKKEVAAKSDQISRQQAMIDNFKDKNTPEYEMATKNLKSYQSDKKSLEKDGEKLGRNIDDNNSDIKKLENENENLKKEQSGLKDKISAQETVVNNVEKELNGIK